MRVWQGCLSERKIYMSDSGNIIVIILVYLMGVCSVVLSGCGEQQRVGPVDLYVDAVMLNELGKNAQAIEKLEESVELNEQFSLAHSLLGDIYQQLEDYPASESSYEKAAGLNRWSFKDYFNLGEVRYVLLARILTGEAYGVADHRRGFRVPFRQVCYGVELLKIYIAIKPSLCPPIGFRGIGIWCNRVYGFRRCFC